MIWTNVFSREDPFGGVEYVARHLWMTLSNKLCKGGCFLQISKVYIAWFGIDALRLFMGEGGGVGHAAARIKDAK